MQKQYDALSTTHERQYFTPEQWRDFWQTIEQNEDAFRKEVQDREPAAAEYHAFSKPTESDDVEGALHLTTENIGEMPLNELVSLLLQTIPAKQYPLVGEELVEIQDDELEVGFWVPNWLLDFVDVKDEQRLNAQRKTEAALKGLSYK